jgi:hypothetical protein
MLILIIKIILTPLALYADFLNMLISFLKWDARFIDNNSDSLNMIWNDKLKQNNYE